MPLIEGKKNEFKFILQKASNYPIDQWNRFISGPQCPWSLDDRYQNTFLFERDSVPYLMNLMPGLIYPNSLLHWLIPGLHNEPPKCATHPPTHLLGLLINQPSYLEYFRQSPLCNVMTPMETLFAWRESVNLCQARDLSKVCSSSSRSNGEPDLAFADFWMERVPAAVSPSKQTRYKYRLLL